MKQIVVVYGTIWECSTPPHGIMGLDLNVIDERC